LCASPSNSSLSLEVVKATKSISLNTLDLNIHSTKLTEGDHVISSSPELSYNEEDHITKITFQDELKPGSKLTLTQKFSSVLNDKMVGFYRSSYKTKDGGVEYLATTQMEPTDARRAFPCFDEPALKAKFTITLIADKKLTCLSNMDVVSEKDVDGKYGAGKKAVTFRETPLMSTYLLAFIVGELNYIETNAFRLPVRVYAPPNEDIEHGRFSLELAAKTLKFYEEEFASPFPLPKMDMIAIPDFSAGAMENWGLVTYRIVDLLFDEKTSGASQKERVAEVVQHELAHQWFGNLVTMDFWDGLWLNEGFATWMSWYSCNKFYPDWKVWETYVIDNLQSALSLDSLRSSHSIEVPVYRADEINEIFDHISYAKGSCVLRMISKYLGEDVFMEGIRRYLKKHAFGNTQTSDLWAALSDASGKDVGKVMETWTGKVGYPVVTVTEEPKSSSIHVKQNRFLRTNDATTEEDSTVYPVFLALRTKDGIDDNATLDKRETSIKLPNLDFFKINADHTGIYRTAYSPERLEKLGEAAKQGLLSTEDRSGMISDAGALAASGHSKTSGLLSLLKGFKNETEFTVWDQLLTRLGDVRGAFMFESKEVPDALKKFRLDLVSDKARELGWTFSDSDGHVLTQFKSLMFSAAGIAGDEKVVTAAKEMFSKFKTGDRSAIDPNIRSAVYNIVLANGGAEEYEAVYNEFQNAPTADEKNVALRCLGRAKSPELIQRTLGLALSDKVKAQDVYLPIASLRTHAEGVKALWQWITSNWEPLVDRLPPSLGMLGTVVQISTSAFTTKAQIADIEKFFAGKSTKGFERVLNQSLDSIKARSNWVERDAEVVKAWLKENGY
jgi:aminopeptidase 2